MDRLPIRRGPKSRFLDPIRHGRLRRCGTGAVFVRTVRSHGPSPIAADAERERSGGDVRWAGEGEGDEASGGDESFVCRGDGRGVGADCFGGGALYAQAEERLICV